MARLTSVSIALLAILAGAWVAQAAAQAQDPALAELAAYKHKKHEKKHEKHGKSDKYDKETKHDKYEHKYEKKTDSYEKPSYKDSYEKPSHKDSYYSGDKSYYEEKSSYGDSEYYSGDSSYYYGDESGPDGTPRKRFISFEVQLGLTTSSVNPVRRLQSAARKLAQSSVQSDWSASMTKSVEVFCSSEVSYDNYKVDEDKTLIRIGEYITDFVAATGEDRYTKCYGHKAKIVGEVDGELTFLEEAEDCDKDIDKEYKLRTDGDIAAIPALLKLHDSVLAADAKVMYAEYYDDRSHAVCGLAYLFKGTAAYGTHEFFEAVDHHNAEATDKFAYFGYAEYVAGFNGFLKGKDEPTAVEIPNSGVADQRLTTEQIADLKAKCKEYRGSLPVVEYGKLEVDLRRFTWEAAAVKIKDASGTP